MIREGLDRAIAAHFFEVGIVKKFAYRWLCYAPRVGDRVVFKGIRYKVKCIEWCLDEDATATGTRLNVIIERMGEDFDE